MTTSRDKKTFVGLSIQNSVELKSHYGCYPLTLDFNFDISTTTDSQLTYSINDTSVYHYQISRIQRGIRQ